MTEKIWTIQEALDWTEAYLSRKGDENPRLSAQWLLSEATGLSRIELYTSFERPLSMPERDILRDIVSRRGAGEPLQYITGEVGFRHITVQVNPGVLIPRPETEVLVSEALASLPACDPDDQKEVLVADLCTGSGCIACSIAHEYPLSRVIATDLSPEAVRLARKNVEALGFAERVEILECDLADAIPEERMGSFDLVVSNPPYIPTAVLTEISREVTDYEPHLALDGGMDGLDVYRRILPWAAQALHTGGSLVVELHETCLEDAANLAEEEGFAYTRIVNDLVGRDRILIATLA